MSKIIVWTNIGAKVMMNNAMLSETFNMTALAKPLWGHDLANQPIKNRKRSSKIVL